MKKLRLVKTKTVKNFHMGDIALADLINNRVYPPKFKEQSKENQRTIQKVLRKSDLIVAIRGNEMITGIPFSVSGSMIMLPIPNLITFYFNSAVSLYNQSEELLEEIKGVKNLQTAQIHIADIGDNAYYHFLMLRITLFFHLAIIIEFVINKNLPETSNYKGEEVSKSFIEQNFTLTEKLKVLNNIGICHLKHDDMIFQQIIRTYQLRSELIHPKTYKSIFDNEEAFKVYPEVITDASMHVDAVAKFVECVEPDALIWI